MKKAQKILFLGMGSPSDPGFEDVMIKGIPFRQYMKENGITTIKPVIESCHGCFDLMTRYSKQMQYLVEEQGAKVVAVLQGGLYFALPSLQATQVTFPIISVPLDEIAYRGIIVPPGHAAIAGTDYERHSVTDGKKFYETLQRQNALMSAEKMLNFEGDSVAVYDLSGKLEERLSKFGIKTDESSSLLLSHCGGPLLSDVKFLNVKLELFCDNSGNFPNPNPANPAYGWNDLDTSFVQIYGAQNLAVFAAKVLSLGNPELIQKIKGLAADKMKTYEERNIGEELDMNPLRDPKLRFRD
jgi:phosphoribosylcarboxyaminoimidazole (NCAIR) mutase